jgi:hypothetical protein
MAFGDLGEQGTGTKNPGTKPKKNKGSNQYLGGAGGATGDAAARKRAMQGYLQVIYGLYKKQSFTSHQQALANQAWSHRWAPSTYAQMLRNKDPRYASSMEFKIRARQAADLYTRFRPGRVAPFSFVKNYAKSGMSQQMLQKKMERSKWFKKEFAGWTEAKKAGSPAGMSPETFLNYKSMWNMALQQNLGRLGTPLEQRMMFSANMTGDEVAKNMAELFGGQEALKWATGGGMNPNDILKGSLSTKFGTGMLSKVNQAARTQGNFMMSDNRKFDLGVDDLSGNIESSGF